MPVALTAAAARCLGYRCQAGPEAFARLTDKLPREEADALLATALALRHLHELDDNRRTAAHLGTGRAKDHTW